MKVIVFDLGGTLMQYVGMPYSWIDFYYQGFNAIVKKYNCNVSKKDIEKSVQILKDFNPRVNYREVDYTAEYIFKTALEHWHIDMPIEYYIEEFWSGLNLSTDIYSDTFDVLYQLKEKGYIIAALTDLPNGMPDYIFKREITELLDCFDCYLSSSVVGYRKPHTKGLEIIADKFKFPITDLIFVGDEEKDRKTADRANCKFIHIQRTDSSDKNSCLYELLKGELII